MSLNIILAILLTIITLVHCLGTCGDWYQYKDKKCFKVIEKIDTEENGFKKCMEVDNSSTLITINNKEEEEFLIGLLRKFDNISENVWLGMKWNNHSFKWLDGEDLSYTNWAEDSVRDGSLECAQLSLGKTSLGKWSDQSCKKKALIVCQRKQDINSNDLKGVVENLIKTVENQQKTIDSQQNDIKSIKNQLIPIGFLYTQLPFESGPVDLWPNMNWIEVTKNYSGLFFRAEGGDSAKFGTFQQANFSSISNIVARGAKYNAWKDDYTYGPVNSQVNQTDWTIVRPEGLLYWLEFYMTSGENRPLNTAVKIWKRTG